MVLSQRRNLSPELQVEAVRLISNGTALMKAKQVLPSMVVGGLGPRSTLPAGQLSSIQGPLGNQVSQNYCIWSVQCVCFSICLIMSVMCL
jgi:hypothetical protein